MVRIDAAAAGDSETRPDRVRERAALFGGELTAGPDAAGYRVSASIPTTDPRSDISDGVL
jgi:hypothetical protein